MKITLNGKNTDIPDQATATQLVAHLQLTGKRIAMEVNKELVLRSEYLEFILQEGDSVEIVHAIGGG
ncbi:MAG: sulfur carrier protein ThiS [Gammaproteobacteria bacterium]|nr:sulfur carrier protein ThiS [Gammaproteobacteria bacterium]